ncbi:MAG: hypothetical protein OXF20_08435 [Gammaproteobacteria bacterium]|nr:hypothetical protein [Gammaproteobacteria bacterium]
MMNEAPSNACLNISAFRSEPLFKQAELAWQIFDDAVCFRECITPAAPILFFGDLHAYRKSRLRILTVGLNPSLHEFPANTPFLRFPAIGDSKNRDLYCYLEAMSRYFCIAPYRSWFNSFEPLLNGMGSSYYHDQGFESVALHTDICSPVATNPTWSRLSKNVRNSLVKRGDCLWHMLLQELRPELVALSVAKSHLDRIRFNSLSGWEIIHRFHETDNGNRRAQPYDISAKWHEIQGGRSLFIFGRAAHKPFGLISARQKQKVGEIALEGYRNA